MMARPPRVAAKTMSRMGVFFVTLAALLVAEPMPVEVIVGAVADEEDDEKLGSGIE
jgi:hypothetical protein